MREHRSRRPSEAVGSAIEQDAGAEKHVQSAQVLLCLRGRNGGVRLARSPESISVEEALRTTEDNFDLVECFGGAKNHCVISAACELSGVLDNAPAAFFEVLGESFIGRPGKEQEGDRKILAAVAENNAGHISSACGQAGQNPVKSHMKDPLPDTPGSF